MTENPNNAKLVKERDRFFFHINGLEPFIEYRHLNNDLVLVHTEVPEELEGMGIAAALVTQTLQYAEDNGLKVVPQCSYVIDFLKKHPEWNRLVDKEK